MHVPRGIFELVIPPSNSVSVGLNATKHSRGRETLAKCDGPRPSERLTAKSSQWYTLVYILIVSLILIGVYFVQDSVFQFERRRNMPVKYNRDVWRKTGECSGVGVC